MCLQCKTPTQKELRSLDSFDLAFLSVTGHIAWMDSFDVAFLTAKALEGHGAKEYLWGPQADLMARAIVGAFNKVGQKYTEEIVAAFDLNGDISVNPKKMERALKRSEKLGKEMWLLCGGKVRTILAETVEASKKHFNRQRRQALKQTTRPDWEAYLADAQADHVAEYMQKYPGRVLQPDVERLVKIAETSPNRRLIDRGQLTERIERIHARGENYFDNLSDVQVGRTWTHSGLQIAMEQHVTDYIIVSELDRKTCPVCQTLHGRRFSVPQAYNRVESTLGLETAEEIAQASPFPRLPQLDNQSAEAIRSMDLAPPFHGRCRCDVIFLWGEVGVEIPATEDLKDFGVKIKNTALVSEPKTTEILQAVANETGARMEGLKYRIKSSKSMLRKMRSELADNPAWKLADLAQEDVNDILRYTMMTTDHTYTSTVTKTLRRLRSEEHEILRLRNYWTRDGYKGVNVVMKNPQGTKYELQFHTPKSLDVKERISHPLYEKLRVSTDKDEIAALERQIADAWKSVPKPTGVSQIDLDVINLTDVYTTREMQQLGVSLRSTALNYESKTTNLLKSVAEQEGAQMEGLKYRIKSSKSMLRKMRTELADNPAWDLADLSREDVNDILRFTMLSEEDAYAKTVTNSLNRLKRENHEILKVKNYWSNDGYHGVNCVLRDPDGIKYELQFHTPESFYVKEVYSHPLYEQLRVSTDIDEISMLEKKIVEVWKPVKVPRGIESVPGDAFDAIPLYTIDDIKKLSTTLRETALAHEEETTALLKGLASKNGARMEGLQYRIKEEKSLFRKMRGELRDNPPWDLKTLVKEDTNDVLRFTMLANEETYSNTVAQTLGSLKREGHEIVRIRNYWTQDGYKGVNCVIRDQNGIKYELQFHTPKSIDVKERISHPLYEKLRVSTNADEIASLEKKIADAWDSVALPRGVERISLEELDDLYLRTYLAPHGIREDFQKAVEQALSEIPDDLLRKFRRKGYDIWVPEDLVRLIPANAGVHPRGWPAGTTWENCNGVHLRGQKAIVIGQEYTGYIGSETGKTILAEAEDVIYTLKHELGHALDDALGFEDMRFSSSKDFVTAYWNDRRRIDKMPQAMQDYLKDTFFYYFQASPGAEQEVFAEMTAILMGNERAAALHVPFPDTYTLVARKLGLRAPTHKQFIPAKTFKEAKEAARVLGAPILPANAKEAAEMYGDVLWGWMTEAQRDVNWPGNPAKAYEKHLQKLPWTKKRALKAFRQGNVIKMSEKDLLRVQNAINENYANPMYRRIVRATSGEHVVFAEPFEWAGGGLSDAAMERLGGVSIVYRHSFWDVEYAGKISKCLPGGATCSSWGSEAAGLRHELAHGLHEFLSKESKDRWRTIFFSHTEEEWEKAVTFYSRERAGREALPELFALVTDPRYDARNFPEWVNAAGEELLDMIENDIVKKGVL